VSSPNPRYKATQDVDPEEFEIAQEEGEFPAIRVHMDDPVRTEALPNRRGACRTITLSTTPVRVLRTDPRRAIARYWVVGFDNAIVGGTIGEVLARTGAVIPAVGTAGAVPVPDTASGELWAAASLTTCNFVVMEERWAN
jgi:hypothetical protein